MSIENKIGIEAEFILLDKKGDPIVVPRFMDRDGFPLLGEIRGKEASSVGAVVGNYYSRKTHIQGQLASANRSMVFSARSRVGLALYKKANKESGAADKFANVDKVRNIYGTDIGSFSDQVISKGKIQGVYVSCGLHIHFSSEEFQETAVEIPQYEEISLPISVGIIPGSHVEGPDKRLVNELMRPTIRLYRFEGYEKKKTLAARASRLNKPAVEYIVSSMDKMFFARFAPPQKERTKYRQPGYFEMKPYGFEYRSLPMTPYVEENLFEIVTAAFRLLREINEY